MRCISQFAALAVVLTCAYASANVGTGLPLDQYQPGTEITNNTLVPNGNFENVTSGQPAMWSLQHSFGVGAATGPNSSTTGSFVAQGPLGGVDQTFPEINGYRQSITLTPNTNYVISAYMWNFGQNFDLIGAEVRDPNGAAISGGSVYLTRNDASAQDPGLILDGSRGVFGFSGFNSGSFGSSTYEILVKFDQDSGGAAPNIGGQIDNVALTPVTQFRPPLPVPEPVSLGIMAISSLALRRRR